MFVSMFFGFVEVIGVACLEMICKLLARERVLMASCI